MVGIGIGSFLLEVSAPHLHEPLQPGPEPGGGRPDLVPRQVFEAQGDSGLQHIHGVAWIWLVSRSTAPEDEQWLGKA